MKKVFKTIFAVIAGMFISKTVNSKDLEINTRVLNIRYSLKANLEKNNESELLTYYKSINNNSNEVSEYNINDSETAMKWHNNPSWNQNWNNFWNQVSWRNWNKTRF